jgi:hypothetical protein
MKRLQVVYCLIAIIALMLSGNKCISKTTSFTTAGKLNSAPVIDGKLNDSCYKECISIFPFQLKGGSLANNQTKVFIGYDDKNLYFGFKCYESCLEPLNNKLHEFKSDTLKNDEQAIFQDDNICIFIAPDNSKLNVAYDLFVNSNGVINDAKCIGPEYWRSRNKKWNSGAKAKGFVGNGFWSLEIAIPLKAIELNPQKNSQCGIILGRIERSQKENSTWSPIVDGFHEKTSFSLLKFTDKVPGVNLLKLPQLKDNNCIFDLQLYPRHGRSKDKLRLNVLVNVDKESFKCWDNCRIKGATKFIAKLKAPPAANFQYAWNYSNPSTMQSYFQSPQYRFSRLTTKLQYLFNKKSVPILLNGAPAEKGANLLPGLNRIEIKAPKGLKGEIIVGQFEYQLDSSWKIKSVRNNSDVEKIPSAEFVDGVLQKSGTLYKTIMLSEIEMWPNWQAKGIFFMPGRYGCINFFAKGIPEKVVNDYELIVEAPDGFEVPGASGYYNSLNGNFGKSSEKIMRNGETFRRYTYKVNAKLQYNKKRASHEMVLFMLRPKTDYKKKKTAIYYYSRALNGNYEEIPNKLEVNIIPSASGKQPSRAAVQMWTNGHWKLDNKKMCQLYEEELIKQGINEVLWSITPGLKGYPILSLQGWSLPFKKYLNKHPEQAKVTFSGKTAPENICLSVLLNNKDAQDHLLKQMRLRVQRERKGNKQLSGFTVDYEKPIYSGDLCFCSKCLADFAKQYSISGKVTPQQLKTKYSKKWLNFGTAKIANMIGLLTTTLRKVDPKLRLTVYSGYQSVANMKIYSTDWHKLAGEIDRASCGYGRPTKGLPATKQAIKKVPLILGIIKTPYYTNNKSYPVIFSQALMMQRFCDSRYGLLIYKQSSFDARSAKNLTQLNSFIAKYENFILDGKNVKTAFRVIYPDEEAYFCYKDKSEKYLMIFNNFGLTAKNFQVKIPASKRKLKVIDAKTGKPLSSTKGVVAPGEFKALLIQ